MEQAGTSALTAEGVWKHFGDRAVLRDITIAVQQGWCLALLGRNGAGKTTLLRVLGGVWKPSRGKVWIRGEEVWSPGAHRRIGVLGHAPGLYEEFTALENLRFFARLYGRQDAEAAAQKWLKRVGLDRARYGLVREFSRGMKQRLALARAFLHEPEFLLLDEPFTALDDEGVKILQGLITEARSEGRTIVLSTHQLREALDLATHVAVMVRGRLSWMGAKTEQMMENPGRIYEAYGEGSGAGPEAAGEPGSEKGPTKAG